MTRPAPFPYDDFRQASETLWAAVEERARYVLLTAPSGVGKTTLLRALDGRLDRGRHRLVYFNLARLTPAGLVRVLARSLRVPVRRSQPETVRAIVSVLVDEPGHTLLVCDEAQLLPDETFAELRTLAEADLSARVRLTILVAGLPRLRDRLQAPHLFPFWRRMTHRIEMTGLRLDEARPFARHLLGEAEADRFADEGLTTLFERSRGVPGLLEGYLRHLVREIPEGPISAEVVEPLVERWDLP